MIWIQDGKFLLLLVKKAWNCRPFPHPQWKKSFYPSLRHLFMDFFYEITLEIKPFINGFFKILNTLFFQALFVFKYLYFDPILNKTFWDKKQENMFFHPSIDYPWSKVNDWTNLVQSYRLVLVQWFTWDPVQYTTWDWHTIGKFASRVQFPMIILWFLFNS